MTVEDMDQFRDKINKRVNKQMFANHSLILFALKSRAILSSDLLNGL